MFGRQSNILSITMGCALSAGLSLAAVNAAMAYDMHPEPVATMPTVQAEMAFGSAGQTMTTIQNHLSPLQNAFDLPDAPNRKPDAQGMSGGDGMFDWSGWSSASVGYTENTYAPTQTNGWNQSATLGADLPLGSGATAGVMFSLSHDRSNMVYNSGSIEYLGATVAPYASFSLTDWLSADMSFGASFANSNQDRLSGATTVTGSYTTNTYFGSAGLSASKWMGNWMVSGRVGVNGSSTNRAAYTESDSTANAASSSSLLQTSIGGTVGFWAAPALFYVSSSYVYDLDRPTPAAGASTDRDELRLSAGATIYGSGQYENITGGLSISKTFLRAEHESTGAQANLRVKF